MDFGSFLRDVGRNLGNFFGGGRKDDEEERRRRQQAAQRPTVSNPASQFQLRPNTPTVQAPQSLVQERDRPQFEAPVIGGVSLNPEVAQAQKILREGGSAAPYRPEIIDQARRANAPKRPGDVLLNPSELTVPRAPVRPQPKPVVKNNEPNIVQKFGAGFQQALGRVADTIIQGGNTLSMGGDIINPFIDEQERQRRLQRDAAAGETLRGRINSWRDITDNNIVGNRDVDEAAGRIAAGQGSAQDLAAVGGRGLDIAGTTTMFINPARTVSGAAATAAPIRSLIPNVLRESALYGGLEGTQAVADTYGESGDLQKALLQFAPNFALGAGSQLGLEGAAYGAGRALRGVAGRTPFVRSVENAGEDAARFVEANQPPEIKGTLPPPREPNNLVTTALKPVETPPISRSANITPPPAVTSPNRPVVPTEVAPQTSNVPEISGVQPLETSSIPTINSFGRKIEMTAENGYEPVTTPDGGTVYRKTSMTGSNRKGDKSATNSYYSSNGTKLTQAQYEAMLNGEIASSAPKVASAAPVESANTVAAKTMAAEATPINTEAVLADTARQAENAAPTDAAAELGSMTRKAVQSGRDLNDADWEQLASDIGLEAERQADELGTDIPTILRKVQSAYDNRKRVKTAKQAGLSEQEFDLYKRFINEQQYLRNRTDPSLLGNGNIDRWYAPRQMEDTEYTPDLVNEISRGANGLKTKDLDLSTVPIEQAIRRYGDAPKVVTDDIINQIENVKVTEGGVTNLVDSGIRVPDDVRAAFHERAKVYIQKKDAVERALADTDIAPNKIDKMVREADKEIDDALSELVDSIPKNTAEGRDAIARIQERRGAYIQSTIRTNMFSNIVNRALDHISSNIVRATNQMAGIADNAASVLTGRRALSSGRPAATIAKDYAKGSLRRNLMRDFRTSVSMANSPIGKVDAFYRAAGTAITGSSDLSTTVVKMTNRMMLARAQAQGITDKIGMEKYLRENLNSPEYKELLTGVNDIYNGYLGLPTSLTSRQGQNGRWLSNVDNLVNKGLERFAPVVPPRIRRELNDLIMPALSGFAGATYRIGKKSLNASMLGVPGAYKGLKLMKEGGEASQQIGQMMIIRSMIDGVAGGAASAATIGAMLSNQMEWTGEYPSDPNEAALWERQGTAPNSLRFKTGQKDDKGNDVYLQIQPGRVLGPFALPVVLPAVIASGGNAQEVFDGTLGQMLDNMGAEGALRNAGNISTALTGRGYDREKAVDNLISSAGFSVSNVIPASGLQNNIANATDPVKRDTSDNWFTGSILNRTPLTRGLLPEKTDNLGDPVINNTVLGSSAITTARKPSQDNQSVDGFDSELERLSSAGFKDVMPGRDVTSKTAKEDARAVLASDFYKSLESDDDKADVLKRALSSETSKDISTKLKPEQRQTLLVGKLMGEDKRDAWLDDNKNAADYYTATYDNLKARNSLSKDDESLRNKDGAHYKAVEAQVNQKLDAPYELKELYGKISQSDFKKMLDPDSDEYDPERAKMLWQYDEARTKAGVSGAEMTDKQKYSLNFKLSGSGRGGRGGRGSDKFAFASLPSSLIGAGTNSSKAYADVAPTFRPIPDLKAPAGAAIPKGRTISVKKGIRI